MGNPSSKVVAMPRFLRIITGDAKAFTNGTANANAAWSCTGFEDRQLTDKYPICPDGSRLVRTSKFLVEQHGDAVLVLAQHRALTPSQPAPPELPSLGHEDGWETYVGSET